MEFNKILRINVLINKFKHSKTTLIKYHIFLSYIMKIYSKFINCEFNRIKNDI